MDKDKNLVIRPRLSEKAYGLSETQGTYVVDVPATANKQSIASAVTAQFGVTVTAVHIVIAKGKTKRTMRKGGRPVLGKRSDVKKAYITLKEGDKLPFFAAVEEAAEKAEKVAAKAAAKKEKK
jgi:large subunit ribosomal protein L23